MRSAKMFGLVGLAILAFVLIGCGGESADFTFNTALGNELAITLGKITEFVETVSPFVWETMVKQVYVEAVSNIVVGLLLLLFAVVGGNWVRLLFRKHQAKQEEGDRNYQDDYQIVAACLLVPVVLSVIIGIATLTAGLKMTVNPEYYAIRELLSVLTG